jgi:HK97 gp10 family phage protein
MGLLDSVKGGIAGFETKRLVRRLSQYGKRVTGKHLRPALREGAKIINKAVKANTPVLAKPKRRRGTRRYTMLRPRPRRSPKPVRGLLKRSFGVRVMKRKKDRVGMLVITGKLKGAAYYGFFVEKGTHRLGGITRKHRKGFAAQYGAVRIKPRHFIQRGFDQSKNQARVAIRNRLKTGLAQAVAEAKRAA